MSRRKSLGQNFLRDRSVAKRIVRALDLITGDLVVEIGPGKGALTGPLLDAAGRIAAVEIDPRLAQQLRVQFDPGRLVLIEGDYLQIPLSQIAAGLAPGNVASLRVAGNLPYSASKPIAAKIVRERHVIERAVLMFQREVAQRLTAGPGTRDYGPMAVLTGLAFDVRTLFDVGPRAFRPPPTVDSRVTLWQRRADSELTEELEPRLRSALAASFGRRRQTIRNNLRGTLRDEALTDHLLDAAGIDGSLRAEQLPADRFVRLARHWPPPS